MLTAYTLCNIRIRKKKKKKKKKGRKLETKVEFLYYHEKEHRKLQRYCKLVIVKISIQTSAQKVGEA